MNWSTILRADAMFYDASVRALAAAKSASLDVGTAQDAVDECEERLQEIESEDGRYEGPLFDEYEKHCIQLEHRGEHLSASCGPMLQSLAAVQVLSAAAVEAFINDKAEARLQAVEWDAFEKCPLEGKWLFFAKMFGCGRLTPGHEPMQGLGRLIRRRNYLMHYKPRREAWSMATPPSFLDRLGLTVATAEDSVGTVKRLISTLSEDLGLGQPVWLEIEGRLGYFDTEYDKNRTLLNDSRDDPDDE